MVDLGCLLYSIGKCASSTPPPSDEDEHCNPRCPHYVLAYKKKAEAATAPEVPRTAAQERATELVCYICDTAACAPGQWRACAKVGKAATALDEFAREYANGKLSKLEDWANRMIAYHNERLREDCCGPQDASVHVAYRGQVRAVLHRIAELKEQP